MNNESIAKVVSNGKKEIHEAVMKALEQKDKEMKMHEQELLWEFDKIVGNVLFGEESYNEAKKDFREKLINNFD